MSASNWNHPDFHLPPSGETKVLSRLKKPKNDVARNLRSATVVSPGEEDRMRAEGKLSYMIIKMTQFKLAF
jgi:hypothetical protein